MSARKTPSIVHLSADYADGSDPTKTRAIRSLVDLTGDALDNTVISLTRKQVQGGQFVLDILRGGGRPRLRLERHAIDKGEAWDYRAPPHGVFLHTLLRQLGQKLADALADHPPDLLVGHKLTIEGIAVAEAARRLARPYAITIQGNTDTRILAARPDLVPLYRKIFQQAAVVVSFAPWAIGQVERKLGKRRGPTKVIPCPTELDFPLAPRPDGSGLLSVFHLYNAGSKNLVGMTQAVEICAAAGDAVPLGIVGGGSDRDLARARRMTRQSPLVTFEGPLERDRIAARMNRAAALVMPSRRESFGLVFIEALFAGLPVIYPASRAIDGYFEQCPFAVAVDPQDTAGLAEAMGRLIAQQGAIKAELKLWQDSSAVRRFTRSQIAMDYSQALMDAAEGPSA